MAVDRNSGALEPLNSENLVRLQAAQKEILAVLHDFCTANDITYFLAAGSALGAVRHGDIIPWDDDIDIGMLRADYEKFLAVAGTRLDERIFVQTPKTDPAYPFFYAKLRLDGTLFQEDAVWALDMHKGIFIDIFPFDAIADRNGVSSWRLKLMSALSLLATSVTREIGEQSKSGVIRRVRLLIYRLRRLVPQRLVHRLYARLAQSGNGRASGQVCCFDMYGLRGYRKTIFPPAGLVPPRPAAFGEVETMIPCDAEDYLTSLFGDYMTPPPEHQQVPVHAQAVGFGEDL